MKKAFVGALASLMLAGAISAVSSVPTNTTTGIIAVVGEGSAPISLVAEPAIESVDTTSISK